MTDRHIERYIDKERQTDKEGEREGENAALCESREEVKCIDDIAYTNVAAKQTTIGDFF